MATERIDIVVTENGSRVVKKNIEDIGKGADTAASAVDFLKRTLKTIGAVALVKETLELMNSVQELKNRLRATGLEGAKLAQVYTALKGVANDTRGSLAGSIELFSRLAANSKELGTSQQDLIGFTKSLNQAIVLSGASADEAHNGLIQLSQGMSAGVLRGQDLKSVLEFLPAVADTIASHFGVTRGKLRDLGEQGKITAQDIVKAFQKSAGDLEKRFQALPPTMGQAFENLKTAVTDAIGNLDESTGASRGLADAMQYLADNIGRIVSALQDLVKVLAVAGAAYGTWIGVQKAQVAIGAVQEWIAYRQAIADGTVVVLGSAKAEAEKAKYLAEAAAAEQLAAQAALDAAAAEEVKAAARLKGVQATQASIVAEREAAIANLQTANAKSAGGAVGQAVAVTPDLQNAQAAVAATKAIEEKAAAQLASVEATQAAIVAEREFATLDLATSPNETARKKAIEAIIEARKNERAILPLVAKEQEKLASAAEAVKTAQEGLNTATAAAKDAERAGALAQIVEARKAEVAILKEVKAGEEGLAAAQVATKEAQVGLNAATKAQAEASVAASAATSAAAGTTSLWGQAVTKVQGLLRGLWAAIAANPIAAIIVAVLALVTALYVWRNEIKIGGEEFATLGGLMSALWDDIKGMWSAVGDFFGALWAEIKHFFSFLQPAIDWVKNLWAGMTGDMGFSLAGLMMYYAKLIDGLIVGFKSAYDIIINHWKQFPAAYVGTLLMGLNWGLEQIEKFAKLGADLINKFLVKIGQTPIDLSGMHLKIDNKFEGEAKQLGQDIAEIVTKNAAEHHGAQDYVKGLLARGADKDKIRIMNETTQGPIDLTQKTKATPVEDEKAIKKLQKELDKLIKEYDTVGEAALKMSVAEDVLTRAVEAGLIPESRKAQLMEQVTEHLRDMADPYGAMIRKIDEERAVLGLSADAQEIEAKVRAARVQLIKDGLPHGEKELQQLRERFKLLQDETKVASARNDAVQAATGAQKAFATELAGVNAAIAAGDLTKAQATDLLVNQNADLFAGTIEQQNAWVNSMQQTYSQIDMMRQADLISEESAAAMKARLQVELQEKQLAGASQVFGQLASLSRSKNRELAAIGKAAAVAQATMDGVLAVQKAWAQGGAYGAPLAIATGIATAANVASIMSTDLGFKTGGSFTVGGTGPADSQMVSFRATPGEKVSVARPEQVRKGDPNAGNGAGGAASNNVRIINVIDPKMVGDFMSTPEGEEVFVNLIQRNGDVIKSVSK